MVQWLAYMIASNDTLSHPANLKSPMQTSLLRCKAVGGNTDVLKSV